MTALTENRYTKHRYGLIIAHPVKAGVHIYKGSLVCIDDTGYAVPGDDVAWFTVAGVAIEECDNTDGDDGSMGVTVQCGGVFSFAKHGGVLQAEVGLPLYVQDDQTVALGGDTEHNIRCGRLEAIDGSSAVWLRLRL